MWTVNDFPAYGMLSGWSTAGRLGCPICMQESQAHVLKYSKKASYFDCHRAFLDANHAYRTDKKSFIKGRVERNCPPSRLSGEAIFAQVFTIFYLINMKYKFQLLELYYNCLYYMI